MRISINNMIGVVVVSSKVGRQEEIGKKLVKKISVLTRNVKNLKLLGLINDTHSVEKITKEVRSEVSGCIIAVSTGGTERIIREFSFKLNKPILIWANQSNNSLPSSLEAFSKLKGKVPIKIFYSEINKKALSEIKHFLKVCEAKERLEKYNIGCIGKPTKWPLTLENKKAIKKLGPEVKVLKLEELVKELNKVDFREIEESYNFLMKKFRKVEVSKKEVLKAIRVYLAMKKLALKNNLSALTINCFDLLKFNFTACLGVSLNNDEGLVVGCEADLQAVLTMIIVYLISGKRCWMANTCRIDENKNTITLAHCTIPTQLISNLKKTILTSHMESGKCVALKGPLEKGEVTLVRLGGNNLDKMVIAIGRVVRSNMENQNLCRTQAEIKLKGKVEKLIANSLGNHLILVYGDLKRDLIDFCKFKNIKPIIIK